MKEPVLVIMAAGMGSRYGGLKQMDKIGSGGELILDFSLYDAMSAGFESIIFIIKKEMEDDFRQLIDHRAGRFLKVQYAFQEMQDLPEGYRVPTGREKPWGTCHAVMSARHLIDGPFAVINADDYYGPSAFHMIYDFLERSKDDEKYRYAMAGYNIENTLTENGHVARGVCKTDGNQFLTEIDERLKILWKDGEIVYTEDDKNFVDIPKGTPVSMNFWGFSLSFMEEIIERFPRFLDGALQNNPLKAEYFLPLPVDQLIREGKATVKVLPSTDKWYGVTYQEDREAVSDALESLKDKGVYPEILWK